MTFSLKISGLSHTTTVIILCFSFCGLVFFLDLSLPLAVATTALYPLIILFSILAGKLYWTLLFSSLATFLTMLAFYLQQPELVSLWVVITNRSLNLFVIWMSAVMGILIIREKSQRSLAEQSLILSEQNLKKAQKMAHLGNFEIELPKLTCTNWSEEAAKMFGFSHNPEGLQFEDSIKEKISSIDRNRILQTVHQSVEEGMPFKIEFHIQKSENNFRIVQGIGEPFKDQDGQTQKVLCSIHDITERRRMEEEILSISEKVQRQIGQDLHDGLGQRLTAITYMSELLRRKLEEKNAPESKDAENIVNVVAQSIDQARNLSRGLFPAELTRYGLYLALKDLASQTESQTKIPCSVISEGSSLTLDTMKSIHLFRIVQEAIHNAVKHSEAEQIQISLSNQNGLITILIEDNGKGFEKPSGESKGMGLSIMAYRSNVIGGKFDLETGIGQGTKISCTLQNQGPSDIFREN